MIDSWTGGHLLLKGGQFRVTDVSTGGSAPGLLLDESSTGRVLLLDGRHPFRTVRARRAHNPWQALHARNSGSGAPPHWTLVWNTWHATEVQVLVVGS